MARLIQLELDNFKSYAGRHVVGPFEHNFSCIIGPNGAGKSNVMDAISFVLGVKSSALRSANLKDLIHRNGAQTYESCYVQLLFEVPSDDAVEQWTFRRSVSSTGQSEYRFNGRTTTFAEYARQMEKLNILVKARNFLVFQGDVEAIAAQSSKDLAKLIEQISGSEELRAEYDRLKADQERATENSTFTFNKKRGINAEIKQYKEQKDEAIKFERLQKERQELIITHLMWKLFHIDARSSKLSEEADAKRASLGKHRHALNQLDAEFKEVKKEQARLHKENLKAEKAIQRRFKEQESRRPDWVKMAEQVSHTEKKLAMHQESKNKLDKDTERQRSDLADLEKQLKQVEKAAYRFEESSRRHARKSGIQLTPQQLEEYHQLKEQSNTQAATEIQKMDELKRQIGTEAQKKSALDAKLEEVSKRIEALEEEQRTFVDRRDKTQKQIERFTQERTEFQKDLDALIVEKRKLDQNEKETEERLADVYGKLTQARYDKKENERTAKFMEAIETMKRIFPGVRGRVVDLCRPTHKKYETAVSFVLGKNIDAVIVDDNKTAIECIQYLKEQQIGSATFLPIDTIQTKPINEKYRSFAKGSRLAIDVLQFDSTLTRAFNYACGNALICDTLDIAREICYKKNQSVKAVTLDGAVIHKAGLMTGGTYGNNTKNRWEERELDNLRRMKTRFEADLKECARTRRKLGNEDQMRSTITAVETRLQAAQEELSMIERKLESLKQELDFLAKERSGIESELEGVETALAKLNQGSETLEQAIASVNDRVFNAFCQKIGITNIQEYEGAYLKESQELNDKRVQFETQKSRLENEISFARDQLDKLMEKAQKLESSIDAESKTLAKLQERQVDFTKENESTADEIKEQRKAYEQAKKQEEEKAAEVATLKNTLQGCNREVDQMSKEISSFESQLEKLMAERYDIFRRCKLEEIDLPLLSGSMDDVPLDETERDTQDADSSEMEIDQSAAARMAESQRTVAALEIDFDQLDDDLKDDEDDATETKFLDRIKALAAEIERMAPNLKAIERLDGVENRLKATNEEFENSRRQAKLSKDRFNTVKKRRHELFFKAYSHIADKIDKIYKELTKSRTHPLGGTAYLTLENNEEPYLEGVKYHAMPPMKRFRDMEQLSGGEKTVAALALLFAIHSYHPSPFFVLDEVDAALDNANVAKVANYIRQHASDSFQFIVISLKNSLYEKSEALVGIYRHPESRSSGVLTLDLTKYEE